MLLTLTNDSIIDHRELEIFPIFFFGKKRNIYLKNILLSICLGMFNVFYIFPLNLQNFIELGISTATINVLRVFSILRTVLNTGRATTVSGGRGVWRLNGFRQPEAINPYFGIMTFLIPFDRVNKNTQEKQPQLVFFLK